MAVQKCYTCNKSSKELHSTCWQGEVLHDKWYCSKCFKKKFPEIDEKTKKFDIPPEEPSIK